MAVLGRFTGGWGMVRRSSILGVLLTLAWSGAAQAREDHQLWTGGALNLKLGGKWRLNQELVARFSDNRNGLYEIESNTLLGYALSPTVALAAGYTHDPQYAAGHFTVMERRAREQVTVDKLFKLGRGSVTGRLRAEQRWRDGLGGTAWRLRPFLRYSGPLLGKAKLVVSNETFVDLNTTGFQRQPGVERMRNFVGLNLPLSKKLALEAGYLNQHFFIRSGDDENDDVASVTLTASL